MGFDFYAEYAVEDRGQVESLVKGEGAFAHFKDAPWTVKAQALRTGIALDGDLGKFIKNGEDGAHAYPQVLDRDVVDYRQAVDLQKIFLPQDDKKTLRGLPDGSCLIKSTLELTRPFYSKDDCEFYPMDNPLKRDWVFQIPYLAASGVKGLLRWAWQACYSDQKTDKEELVFGPRSEKMDDNNARQGCLYIWPIFWKGTVKLEIINPQERETGAGSTPVRYETVQPGGQGELCLLLLNRKQDRDFLNKIIPDFLKCLNIFLEGGLSAKRSADWGSVKSRSWKASIKPLQKELTTETQNEPVSKDDPVEQAWAQVIKDDKLKDFSDPAYTKKVLALITGRSEKRVKKEEDRQKAFQRVQQLFEERTLQKSSIEDTAPEPHKDSVKIENIFGRDFNDLQVRFVQKVKEGV